MNFTLVKVMAMKIGYSYKEAGRLTIKQWAESYQAYKDIFDKEMMMINSRTTYAELHREITIDDVIPF